MQEHKKESFFKNLFWGISKKTQKNSKKTKKSVDNFDSWIDFIKGLIFEKNRKKSLSIIAKIRKIEENNISLILKKSKDNEKEDIKRIYSEKISILDSFEKSIKDSIIKEKDEKKIKRSKSKVNLYK
jgi:hypothetical protein